MVKRLDESLSIDLLKKLITGKSSRVPDSSMVSVSSTGHLLSKSTDVTDRMRTIATRLRIGGKARPDMADDVLGFLALIESLATENTTLRNELDVMRPAYKLTITERDYERVRCNRLETEITTLRGLLKEAFDAGEYCGWGDTYEREPVVASKLQERIEAVLPKKDESK